MNPVPAVQVKNISSAMVLSANHSRQHLDVVAAIIINVSGQILVAQRALHKFQGGLWEFPGGKVEAGESLEAALKREIFEELGIHIQIAEFFLEHTHSYPDKDIRLHVWQVTQFQGEAYGKEGQPIQWISKEQLKEIPFPEANQVIVQAITR